MINLKGTYIFPNYKNIEFVDPKINIKEVVIPQRVINDPDVKEIDVKCFIVANKQLKGTFYIDVNPVKVVNLNYDGGELIQRVTERLKDFKIK